MKNLYKVFGLIVLVAIIGFSFAACGGGGGGDDGDGGGGGNGNGYLTINGLPSGSSLSYSAYVFSSSKDIPDSKAAISQDYLASGINGDKVFSLFVKNESTEWTGTGSFQVVLVKSFPNYEYWKATVNFTNGNATVNYSIFTVLN